jgi:hypothetical protein
MFCWILNSARDINYTKPKLLHEKHPAELDVWIFCLSSQSFPQPWQSVSKLAISLSPSN